MKNYEVFYDLAANKFEIATGPDRFHRGIPQAGFFSLEGALEYIDSRRMNSVQWVADYEIGGVSMWCEGDGPLPCANCRVFDSREDAEASISAGK